MAWAGIASSSVSWLTCCCAPIPFVGALAGLGGVLFAIVGIVCGVLGYQSAKRVGGRTDLPIIAIVIGSVRIVLTVGFVVLVVVLVGAAGVAAYFEQAGR